MAEENNQPNGWTRYQELVLQELDRHNETLETLRDDLTEIKVEQAKVVSEVESSASSVETLSKKIEEMIRTLNGHKTDIAILKLKIYGVVTALCAGITILFEVGFKFFTGK